MEALVMAGGKGTRMGRNGVEKPMTMIGSKHTVGRVVDALLESKYVDRVLVSVSSNTPETEKYLKGRGIETLRTSGEGFVEDLHSAFGVMNGKDILCLPSDLPLIRPYTIDAFIEFFNKRECDSAMAIVEKDEVVNTGITPSFTFDIDGSDWVISGVSIMNRQKTLDGKILESDYFKTDWVDLAINVNTDQELQIARGFFDDDPMSH
jgi:adenosylcobinamide-phosphate guanylyltransferase